MRLPYTILPAMTICLAIASAQTVAKETSPTVPATTGSKTTQRDAQLALDFHNTKRRELHVPPLQWSPKLAAVAQSWADNLATTLNCAFKHSPNNVYGENLFAGSAASYNALDASQTWFDESKGYKPAVLNNDNWYAAGHYTQMVWRSTTEVGFGQATCTGGQLIIVAEYDPAGNVLGERPY